MGEINWERELPTTDYHTMCDVGHWNKAGVPPINKEQNGLMAHSWCSALFSENCNTFGRAPIDAFDDHGIMVFAADSVDVQVHQNKWTSQAKRSPSKWEQLFC